MNFNKKEKMKVLNLYAGIGGNRKLWQDVDVTAVEYNPSIAAAYKDFFPNDNVIVADAHEYLLNHYAEYDFIWSSPPCPTHSRIAINFANAKGGFRRQPKYPDMRLYQEIIFLEAFAKCAWVVENVVPYYEPLIKPKYVGRHCFWSNFHIEQYKQVKSENILRGSQESKQKIKGFDVSNYNGFRKDQVINNCVVPELGLHILNSYKPQSNYVKNDVSLFDMVTSEF